MVIIIYMIDYIYLYCYCSQPKASTTLTLDYSNIISANCWLLIVVQWPVASGRRRSPMIHNDTWHMAANKFESHGGRGMLVSSRVVRGGQFGWSHPQSVVSLSGDDSCFAVSQEGPSTTGPSADISPVGEPPSWPWLLTYLYMIV